jgi:hypothetical protein
MVSFRILRYPLSVAGSAALATAVIAGGPAILIANADHKLDGGFAAAAVVVVSLFGGLLAATLTLGGSGSTGKPGFLGWFAANCPVSNVIAFSMMGAAVAAAWFAAVFPIVGAVAMGFAAGAVGVRGHLLRRSGISCPVPAAGRTSLSASVRSPAGTTKVPGA